MKIHVIYAHPVAENFSTAIHRTVVETLTRSGHEVRDLDLYAQKRQDSPGPQDRP